MHGLDKVLAAAMHRHHDVGFEVDDFAYDVLGIIHRRLPEVKTAKQRVHFGNARNGNCLFGCIDDAAVSARRQDDKPAALHIKNGCVLVVMLIRDDFSQ